MAIFSMTGGGGPGPVRRRGFLQILGGLVVSTPVALEIYSRLGPSDAQLPSELLATPSSGSSWQEIKHATLVFHGAAGQDEFTDRLMKNLQLSKGNSFYSAMVEWSQFSSNILQASFNGQRIGRLAGKQLRQNAANLKTVHLIGISVGAFAADEALKDIKNALGGSVFVQLTLLDPFTQRGFFDTGYGDRIYGLEADYFQHYINTDDPVPSTNAPLSKSVCFDITSIRPDEVPFGHDWPVAYYGAQKDIGIVPLNDRKESGTLITVKR